MNDWVWSIGWNDNGGKKPKHCDQIFSYRHVAQNILHALAGDRNRTSLTRGRMRHGKTQHAVIWVWSSFFVVRTSNSWRIFLSYTPDMIRWQSLRGELLAGWTVQLSLTEGHNGFLKVNYVTFQWNELPRIVRRCCCVCNICAHRGQSVIAAGNRQSSNLIRPCIVCSNQNLHRRCGVSCDAIRLDKNLNTALSVPC